MSRRDQIEGPKAGHLANHAPLGSHHYGPTHTLQRNASELHEQQLKPCVHVTLHEHSF